MFIFKGFILYLVYLFIYSNCSNIILNATGICAFKKVDNLTWSITFNIAILQFFFSFFFLWEWYHYWTLNLKYIKNFSHAQKSKLFELHGYGNLYVFWFVCFFPFTSHVMYNSKLVTNCLTIWFDLIYSLYKVDTYLF